MAVMTYLDDRDVREALYRANSTRAASEPYDNRENILKILALRQEKAKLLGFSNFADLVLVDRMAKTGAAAELFLTDLRAKTDTFFARENEDLRAFAGGRELEPWDVGYYAEKQRVALYDFDEEQLRPYFSLSSVMAGLWTVSRSFSSSETCLRTSWPYSNSVCSVGLMTSVPLNPSSSA